MNTSYFNWIWHVRGSVSLPAGQSPDDAMVRLEPLFEERGTSYRRNQHQIVFDKKGQPAQDKMSVFDHGELRIEHKGAGYYLSYHLVSRAFLFCFLAPVLFLALAFGITLLGDYEEAHSAAAAETSGAKDKDDSIELPQSPIDKFLGAPEPEIEVDDKKDEEKGGKGPSPTPAFVFAAIFACLYVVGRLLEPFLVKRLFTQRLIGSGDDVVPTRGKQPVPPVTG